MNSYLEERFPHIIARLEKTWGNSHKRGGRTGWPAEDWAELSWLNQLHKLVCQEEGAVEEDPTLHDTIKWVS